MGNDSSTGGYLSPAATPAPLEGSALNDFLQAFMVGISGIGGTLVRPAFQTEPPVIPEADTLFMTFRYETRPADQYPYVDAQGNMQRHEDIHILCSFYDTGTDGQADTYAALLRDGLAIDQNLEVLSLNNMGLREVGDLVAVPVLIKSQWEYRVDFPFVITREILRSYPVLPLETANIELIADPSNDVVIVRNIQSPIGE